jgi:hypothetical protein
MLAVDLRLVPSGRGISEARVDAIHLANWHACPQWKFNEGLRRGR